MPDAATQTPALPFPIASQYSQRFSFAVGPTQLGASAPTPVNPIVIPAVGYIAGIMLEVTIAGTGGTTPAFTADAPWNVIQNLNLRNAAGVNLITPLDGYSFFAMNKYGGASVPGFGPWADPRHGIGYSATAPDAHFFLWIPRVIDPTDGFGAIPALASNASYQMELMLAAQSTVTTSNPTLNVTITGDVFFYDLPAAVDSTGIPQETAPIANGSVSLWLSEYPDAPAGEQLIRSVNVGNTIRNHILILRNSAGARVETSAWPALMELYINNNPRFSFRKSVFENLMARWYGLAATTKDVVNGLDTGVFVFPYHALLNGVAGNADNTRAQLLSTIDSTLLQFRGQSFGASSAKLQILTEVVSTADPQVLYGK